MPEEMDMVVKAATGVDDATGSRRWTGQSVSVLCYKYDRFVTLVINQASGSIMPLSSGNHESVGNNGNSAA